MTGHFNPFSLEGKIVLITGASSGIGHGIAIICSRMGATILINGRNKEHLEETLSQLEGNGHQMLVADLTSKNEIDYICDIMPKVDGIVHCAGIGQRKLCRELEGADIDSVMNINFKASVLLQTAILQKKKINKGGSIVFVASMASHSPSIGNAVYSASKGAIISYANCLELELAPKKVRVNCISPAMVWTDLILQEGISREELEEDEKRYPLKRYGSPEDIANLAVYMLSDASSWMTGSNVEISGGVFNLSK